MTVNAFDAFLYDVEYSECIYIIHKLTKKKILQLLSKMSQ